MTFFVRRADEQTLATLLRRNSIWVWAACRRILDDDALADVADKARISSARRRFWTRMIALDIALLLAAAAIYVVYRFWLRP